MNEAALLTIRAGRVNIESSDLTEAVDRVLSGPRKRGKVLSEAGAACVRPSTRAPTRSLSAILHAPEAVEKITILPRGKTVAGTSIADAAEGSGIKSTSELDAPAGGHDVRRHR